MVLETAKALASKPFNWFHYWLFAGGVCRELETVKLDGKVVLVTGASPGSIGEATVKLFRSIGATVVMTATTKQHINETVERLGSGSDLVGMEMDLSDMPSVENFCKDFHARFDRLDVLVNNAGIHLDLLSPWKEPKVNQDEIELHWRVNFLGTSYLTLLLLPKLEATGKKTGDARIVNVVSMLHRLGSKDDLIPNLEKKGWYYPTGYNSWKAYGRSKLALLMFMNELNRREAEKNANVTINSLHPGTVYSNIPGGEVTRNTASDLARQLASMATGFFLKTPEEGSQTTLYCSISKELVGVGGKYFADCRELKASKDAYDTTVAKELFDRTCAYHRLTL